MYTVYLGKITLLIVRTSFDRIRHIKTNFRLRYVIPETNIAFFRVLDNIRQ